MPRQLGSRVRAVHSRVAGLPPCCAGECCGCMLDAVNRVVVVVVCAWTSVPRRMCGLLFRSCGVDARFSCCVVH
eukprot:4636614-Prymnesium_polylepis.1